MAIYESDAARTAAMYRLLGEGPADRVLVIRTARTLARINGNIWWSGARVLDAPDLMWPDAQAMRRNLELLPDCSFDEVILHGMSKVLPDLTGHRAMRRAHEELLQQAHRILAPRGVIAGCVESRFDVKAWAAAIRSGSLGAGKALWTAGHTVRSCHKLLEACAFRDVRTFIILPSKDAPRQLVSTVPSIASEFFRRAVLQRSQRTFAPGTLAESLVAVAGLDRYLRGPLLFRGIKSC